MVDYTLGRTARNGPIFRKPVRPSARTLRSTASAASDRVRAPYARLRLTECSWAGLTPQRWAS